MNLHCSLLNAWRDNEQDLNKFGSEIRIFHQMSSADEGQQPSNDDIIHAVYYDLNAIAKIEKVK